MNKKEFLKKIDRVTGAVSNPTEVIVSHTLIAKGFVLYLWEQWKKDCQEHYNDIHWVKIWSDHLKARVYDTLINSSVVYQKPEVENKKEEKEEEIPMIGDGGKGDGK